MRIAAVDVLPVTVPLTRPYAIATRSADVAHMVRVRIEADDGSFGLGAATPEASVTGESFDACVAALRGAEALLRSRAFAVPADLDLLLRADLPGTPAARAALDMALHDLWGKAAGRPLVDLLGRVHQELPTSVTIGVRDVADTLAEAREYLARGFRVLKVKVGTDIDLDVERLARLRALAGAEITLLADANTGYSIDGLRRFLARTDHLDLALVEQPLPRDVAAAQVALPPAALSRLAADESLLDERDARALAGTPRPFGVFNIKLMKCGGITPALAIARIADAAGLGLMWGCMDESVIGIAAALHAAFASPATRHLDLDGSFDLARDFGRGGFVLQDGRLRTTGLPGLGVAAAGQP